MSFLKKIWKPLAAVGSVVAAPFTGGTSLAWLPAVLGGAAAVGNAFGGGGKQAAGGTGGNLKSQSEQTLMDTQKRAMGVADELQPTSRDFLGLASRSFNPVVDYWSTILGGNRSAINSTLSPELTRIGEGYDAARKSLFSLSPRGGGTSSMMAELPFAQQRDVSNLFSTARPKAAAGLMEAGKATAGAGMSGYDSILNALGGATRSSGTALDTLLQRRSQNLGIGSKIGEALPGLIKILMGLGKGGGISGGCWVITAVYGRGDPRVPFLWAWFTNPECGWSARSRIGWLAQKTYMAVGRPVAWLIRTLRLSRLLQPAFDRWCLYALRDLVR